MTPGPGRKGAAAEAAAVTDSLARGTGTTAKASAPPCGPRRRGGGDLLRSDGTAECDACGLPLFPYEIDAGLVRTECANHHHAQAPLPTDAAIRRMVDSWIARRGAQLHAQHERWGTDDEDRP